MVKSKNKAFTLIELLAVLVIIAMLVLIAVPLVMSVIRRAKDNARKRSVDNYGKAVEASMMTYMLDNGYFPTNEQLSNLQIDYTGSHVVCNVMQIKENGGLYMSECTVDGKDVLDSHTEDGWYHYNKRDLSNIEYVNMYGDALEAASIAYYNENDSVVSDYKTLTTDYKGKDVECDVTVNYNGTIYMTKCKVNKVDVTNETEKDGYYHYGSIVYSQSIVIDLLAKANASNVTSYTAGKTGEMYAFSHPATDQTGALTDYRYIGATPNNYVTFNNELWRIIGVFTVEDENGNAERRVKIIKNEKLLDDMYWDSRNLNEWTNATLNTYLNGEYYNGIDGTSKNMISDTKYYLGGNPVYDNLNGENYYSFERGTTVYSVRSISWNGKISLMYPSDYSYAYALGVDNDCYANGYNCSNSSGKTNSWIYNTNSNSNQWLLSPISSGSYLVFGINSSGFIGISATGFTGNLLSVRPVLYLKSNTRIKSGDGTSTNPYNLEI